VCLDRLGGALFLLLIFFFKFVEVRPLWVRAFLTVQMMNCVGLECFVLLVISCPRDSVSWVTWLMFFFWRMSEFFSLVRFFLGAFRCFAFFVLLIFPPLASVFETFSDDANSFRFFSGRPVLVSRVASSFFTPLFPYPWVGGARLDSDYFCSGL